MLNTAMETLDSMTGNDNDLDDDKNGQNYVFHNTGGGCQFNTTTGIPDENCYFVPDPNANISRYYLMNTKMNKNISKHQNKNISSYMAVKIIHDFYRY